MLQGLDFIEKVYKEFDILRVKHLPVSGAFHTELMYPARAALKTALERTTLDIPVVWCYSNTTGKKHSSHSASIKRNLVQQVTKQVQWEQTICRLYERDKDQPPPATYECGPGKQLLTLLKLTNGKAFKNSKSVDV